MYGKRRGKSKKTVGRAQDEHREHREKRRATEGKKYF
jgi:hypothetical protein